MISIIPALDIMKAVTDSNITSDDSNYRRIAFDKATELMSETNAYVLLEGNLYTKLCERLNEDHKSFFQSVYKIDNSAKDVPSYNITKSVIWIAKSEDKIRDVIILTDDKPNYEKQYLENETICVCNSKEFLAKVELARHYHRTKRFTSLDDALIAIFFVKH